MSKNATLRLLAVGLLLCWCGLFLRTETTEKSMVRLIFADPTETGWTVGLLYQFPEAAADSADAAASVRLALGEGETPEKALLAAEKALHQRANYRLCEYLLLGPGWSGSALQTWEPLVQQHPELRLSIKLLAAEFSGAALAAQAEETEQLPEQLLQTVKTAASAAPRLYRFRRDQGPFRRRDSHGSAFARGGQPHPIGSGRADAYHPAQRMRRAGSGGGLPRRPDAPAPCGNARPRRSPEAGPAGSL